MNWPALSLIVNWPSVDIKINIVQKIVYMLKIYIVSRTAFIAKIFESEIIQKSLRVWKTKDLNRIAKIGYGDLYLREENLSFIVLLIITRFRNWTFQAIVIFHFSQKYTHMCFLGIITHLANFDYFGIVLVYGVTTWTLNSLPFFNRPNQHVLHIYSPKKETQHVKKYNLLQIFNIILNTEISITLHWNLAHWLFRHSSSLKYQNL